MLPFIAKAGFDAGVLETRWLDRMVEAVKPNLTKLADIGPYLAIFDDSRFRIEEEAATILREEEAQRVIQSLLLLLMEEETFDRDEVYPRIMTKLRSVTGAKGKKLFMPVRSALTGTTRGPELDKIFPLLEKKTILTRLRKALCPRGNSLGVSP